MTPQPLSVLIVDDDPAALEELRRFLHRRGYRVLIAETGDAAVDVIAAEKIDFVLSDIRMPGMRPRDMIEKLRAIAPDIPIALMTGQPVIDDDLDPARMAIETVLKKPVSLREISALLEQAQSR